MRKYLIATACSALVVGSSLALAAEPEPALGGYCPVCLVKLDKLVKGDPSYSSTFDGRTYLFPGAEQKRMFDANPAAFAPVLGGDCTVCRVENQVTYDELAEQGPTLTHTIDCAADRDVQEARQSEHPPSAP